MKYKATVSFAGQVSMAAGEVRELPGDVADPLLDCGYLVPEKAEPSPVPKKPGQKK